MATPPRPRKGQLTLAEALAWGRRRSPDPAARQAAEEARRLREAEQKAAAETRAVQHQAAVAAARVEVRAVQTRAVNPFYAFRQLYSGPNNGGSGGTVYRRPAVKRGHYGHKGKGWTVKHKTIAAVVLQKADYKLTTVVNLLKNNYGDLFEEMGTSTLWNWIEVMKAAQEKGEDPAMALVGRKRNKLIGTCVVPPVLLDKIKQEVLRAMDSGLQLTARTMQPLVKSLIQASEFRDILSGQGGTFKVSLPWLRRLARRLGLSRRAATTAAQKEPDNVQEVASMWLAKVAYIIGKLKVPQELVVNADQTGLNLVPVGKHTYARLGSKSVKLLGIDDKRQITVVVASAADGTRLPLQLIFQGNTQRSLPPEGCRKILTDTGAVITQTENHWANVTTTRQWFTEICVPYLERVKAEKGLPPEYPALVILDMWKVHMCKEVKDWAKGEWPWIHFMFIPAGCTGRLQPADVGLQKPFKDAVRTMFQVWLLHKAANKASEGEAAPEVAAAAPRVNMRLSHLKPLVPAMALAGYERLTPELVRGAWRMAGIAECFTKEAYCEALVLKDDGKIFTQGLLADADEAQAYGDPEYVGDWDSDDERAGREIASRLERLEQGDQTAMPRAPDGSAVAPINVTEAHGSDLERAVQLGLTAVAAAEAARDAAPVPGAARRGARAGGRAGGQAGRGRGRGGRGGRGTRGRGAGGKGQGVAQQGKRRRAEEATSADGSSDGGSSDEGETSSQSGSSNASSGADSDAGDAGDHDARWDVPISQLSYPLRSRAQRAA